MKKCTKCKEIKELTEFHKYKNSKDGLKSRCKRCRNKNTRLYYVNNKEKCNEQSKLRYEKNKQKRLKQTNEWRNKNRERVRLKERCRYKKNRKAILTRFKERKKNDIQYKLRCILRDRLNKAIKANQKSGSAVKDLGCSIKDLKIHLEEQFVEGMNWNNHGSWHLDHIKPLASFDLTDREQFLIACNFSNLQPLWAKDNLSKGCKLYFPDIYY